MNDIAIVGISCRFPGADNKEEFWSNLVQGVDSVTEIPQSRWNVDDYYSDNAANETGKTYCRWMGCLNGIDGFDNSFWGISHRDAEVMDPCHRLILQESWKCIEDSAIPLKTLQEKVTSVHIGSFTHEVYHTNDIDVNSGSGSYHFMLANRISYHLDLSGQSVTIDTACSSCLTALNSALQALSTGQSDYALFGGVNLHLGPEKYLLWSKARMLSPTGKCHTFDADADGYVSGEGVGLILLQPLDKAIEERSHIYAVIRNCHLNHGAKGVSLTAPNIPAQVDVITNTYSECNIPIDTVSYIEAHGTGTSLGDPIEIEALTQAFKTKTDKTNVCVIGSVKTNIGHLDGCSAMASIIKVTLMLNHHIIPKSLHLQNVNPIIDMSDSPFRFATKTMTWENADSSHPLRAGINAFGFGGSNGHAILEEYNQEYVPIDDGRKHLFVLSAKSYNSLQYLKQDWKKAVAEGTLKEFPKENISYSLLTGRESFRYRLGIYSDSLQDLQKCELFDSDVANGKSECICFPNTLFHSYDDFSDCLKVSLSSLLSDVLGEFQIYLSRRDLIECFYATKWPDELCQLFTFAINLSIFSLMTDAGYVPSYITGTGEGFYAAVVCAGIIAKSDMIPYLASGVEIPVHSVNRPSYPFIDIPSHRTLFRYNIQACNLVQLIKQVYVSEECIFYYVNKALALYGRQYTFSKYMEEWNPYISILGGDIEWRIKHSFQIFVLHDSNKALSATQLVILVIIISSLDCVNQKWGLKCKKQYDSTPLDTILYLIENNYLQKSSFVQLAYSKCSMSDLDNIGKELNEKLNAIKPDVSLALDSDSLFEIGDVSSWLHDNDILGDNEFASERTTLTLKNDLTGRMTFDYGDSLYKTKEELFLSCWLNGNDIKWDKALNLSPSDKVPLPLYHFDETSFWHKQDCLTSLSSGVDPITVLTPSWQSIPEIVGHQNTQSKWVVIYDNSIPEKLSGLDVFRDAVFIDVSNSTHKVNEREAILSCNAVLLFPGFDCPDVLSLKTDDDYSSLSGSHLLLCAAKMMADIGLASESLDVRVFINLSVSILNESTNPLSSMSIGLSKSIAGEFANWSITVFDIQSVYDIPLCLDLKFESRNHRGRVLACRDGEFYENILIPQKIILENRCSFKNDGCYILFGGSGGVGIALAKHIVSHYNAGVIIVGRSDKSAALERLKEAGIIQSKVSYFQVDISDYYEVKRLFEIVYQQWGTISAVFNLAAVIKDSLIINSDVCMLRDVSEPKVNGTINVFKSLFELNIKVDYVLSFSSIESFLALPGQCSYIASCYAQDVLAKALEKKTGIRSIVINWGFWGDVGMATDKFYHQKFKSIGLFPIHTEEGIHILEKVLQSDLHQVIIVRADNKLLADISMGNTGTCNVSDTQKCLLAEDVHDTIKLCLTEILHASDEDIDDDVKFSSLGVDSITELELIECIQERLGVELKPMDTYNHNTLGLLTDYVQSLIMTNS